MNRRAIVFVISVTAGCAVQAAPPAGSPAQVGAPVATPPAGGHRYQLVARPGVSYEKAEALAAGMTLDGMKGHLARLETPDYGEEALAIYAAIHGPATRPNKWYWIGALRANPPGPPKEGWRWNDGTDVPPSITATWEIDMMEGRVPEAACVNFDRDHLRVGDYGVVNATGIVDGYIVEFE